MKAGVKTKKQTTQYKLKSDPSMSLRFCLSLLIPLKFHYQIELIWELDFNSIKIKNQPYIHPIANDSTTAHIRT